MLYSSLEVSSIPLAIIVLLLKKECSLFQKHVRTELAIARRKDICKLDGPHRGVDSARCRSPEGSVEARRTPPLRRGRCSLSLTGRICVSQVDPTAAAWPALRISVS